MSALLDLALRCEQATGPDRELDAAIAVALGVGARGLLADDHEYLTTVRTDDGCAPGTYWFNCRSGKSLRTAPEFTASLEAAMTLVPQGSGYNLDRYWIREGVRWEVEIATGGVPEQPRLVHDCWDTYTAALATCAAALRAHLLAQGQQS